MSLKSSNFSNFAGFFSFKFGRIVVFESSSADASVEACDNFLAGCCQQAFASSQKAKHPQSHLWHHFHV